MYIDKFLTKVLNSKLEKKKKDELLDVAAYLSDRDMERLLIMEGIIPKEDAELTKEKEYSEVQ